MAVQTDSETASIDISSETSDLDEIAAQLKDELDEYHGEKVDIGGLAIIEATEDGHVRGGFDRDDTMFTAMIGAIDFMKQVWVDRHR